MLDTCPREVIIGLGLVAFTGLCWKFVPRARSLAIRWQLHRSPLLLSMTDKMKMTLVVRDDLKMGKGKIAAQCAHAALEGYLCANRTHPQMVRRWMSQGQAKVVLKVKDEQELLELQRNCKSKGVSSCVIRDAGHTQVEPNTLTVLCIGPAPVSIVTELSGHLKLM